MDILLLRTFMAVTNTGSFSAASRELNCVQSNVTARIRRLEDHLGHSVFERGRGGARLTVFGLRLKAHAEDLLARFDLAEKDMLDASGESAPLIIGAIETAAAVRLPRILKELKRRCPSAPVSLHTGSSADLVSLLWSRKIDVAFIADAIDDARFRGVNAFTEYLTEIKSASGGDSLLSFRSGCSYRAQTQAWLRNEGRADTKITDMGSIEGILGCVDAGMGFAVAPESVINFYNGLYELETKRLPAPFFEAKTNLIWRHDQKKTKAHQTIIDLVSGF